MVVYVGCFGWIPIGIVAIIAGIVVAVGSGDGRLFLLTTSSGTMLGYAAVIYAALLCDWVGERQSVQRALLPLRTLGDGLRRERRADRVMWLVLLLTFLLVGLPVPLLVTVPVLSGHGLAVLGAGLILTTPALLYMGMFLHAMHRFFTEGE